MSEMRIVEHDVAVPGGFVFVREWDPGTSAPPVVLLHDSLGSVELWRDLPATLARLLERRVVAYDRLGFGRSSARHERPSRDFIEEEARTFFSALREALAIDAFGLLGHSVGGTMALAIAAQSGEACRWVVSESAQAFVEARTLEGVRAAKRRFAEPGRLERLERWHGDKARWVLDAWTEVWLDPAFATWSIDAALASVTAPVLAIHGDRDEFGSEAFPERIVAGVRGPSRLLIVPDCGHVPHREHADTVLAAVRAFVDTVESGADVDI